MSYKSLRNIEKYFKTYENKQNFFKTWTLPNIYPRKHEISLIRIDACKKNLKIIIWYMKTDKQYVQFY